MPISKSEFEIGKSPLEKDSLEYKILEFLKKNNAAYTLEEILKAFNATLDAYENSLARYATAVMGFNMAISNLMNYGKISSRTIRTFTSGDTLYYIAL